MGRCWNSASSNLFTQLFQLLTNLHAVSQSWKTSTINPIPKKNGTKAMNEWLLSCGSDLGCCQMSWKLTTAVNLITNLLDTTGSYVPVLFMIFPLPSILVSLIVLLQQPLNLNVITIAFFILFLVKTVSQRLTAVCQLGWISFWGTCTKYWCASGGCSLSSSFFIVYKLNVYQQCNPKSHQVLRWYGTDQLSERQNQSVWLFSSDRAVERLVQEELPWTKCW